MHWITALGALLLAACATSPVFVAQDGAFVSPAAGIRAPLYLEGCSPGVLREGEAAGEATVHYACDGVWLTVRVSAAGWPSAEAALASVQTPRGWSVRDTTRPVQVQTPTGVREFRVLNVQDERYRSLRGRVLSSFTPAAGRPRVIFSSEWESSDFRADGPGLLHALIGATIITEPAP
ncbi:MAG: hypothetical protein WDM79_12450 [Terricaulis sp.]